MNRALASNYNLHIKFLAPLPGNCLVFVKIDFFCLNWFYFSTSWLIFLFLQFCLLIFLVSVWFDKQRNKKVCFGFFGVCCRKFVNQIMLSVIECISVRAQCKTNTWAHALDARAHIWSIGPLTIERTYARSHKTCDRAQGRSQQQSTTFFLFFCF